jgi:L-ascorbate 6-phosphate lactonase
LKKRDTRSAEVIISEINETKVPFGSLALWFIGQEGVIVKGGDTVIYIDPYVSEYLEREHKVVRNYAPLIVPASITNANYYLITHEHLDHLDPDTVAHVAKHSPSTQFVAPGWCRKQMIELGVSEAVLHDANTKEALVLEEGLEIFSIPAAHESLEFDAELGHRYVGYIIRLNGVTLYHAGDTVVYPGLVERLADEEIDIGMVPINGGDAFRRNVNIIGNMGYREAVEFAHAVGFDMTIPLHYDAIAGNGENPGYFIDYFYSNYPYMKCHVMARTERFMYVK